VDPTDVLPYFRFEIRSISDRPYWEAVAAAPQLAEARAKMHAALAAATSAPPIPRASEYLAARRHNDRDALDRYWQSHRGTLGAMAVARCLDGDCATGVDDRLLDWLWAALTQPSWVVSAHLPGNDLPHPARPQFDLAACEMAALLAETLVLLRPWIDNQSQTLAESIVHEIDRRVLTPFAEMPGVGWFDMDNPHWNNWTGVCAGSILAACEALAEIGQPRPAAKARALKLLGAFLYRAFTPDGECDEGVGYWAYGIGFATVGWSRLREGEFRASVDQDRFRRVIDYPRRVHLFDNTFFSGNDANLQCGPPLYATAWLAAAAAAPWVQAWTRANLVNVSLGKGTSMLLREIDAAIRLHGAPAPLPASEATRFVVDQQAVIETDSRLTVAFSGGNNAENHNHNDLGHFNVWHGKLLVVPDMGAPHYTADFFGPNRYHNLTANSRGHCCPVINGHLQRTGNDAAGVMLECDLEKRRFTIDLTAGYPPVASLRRWTRSLRRVAADTFEIEDVFDLPGGGDVESAVWSVFEPVLTSSSLHLGPVTIAFTPSTTPAVEAFSSTALMLRTPPHTLYRIALPAVATAGSPLRMTLRIKPADSQDATKP
jgi:hypothetical protein